MGPAAELLTQWTNPSDVTTILMIIGGDVVRNAFAQGAGKIYTPVCFSFGCVAYAFTALVNIIGEGRLLPAPDYPVKVFNLDSGYMRDNKNWVVGRMLRDIETGIARGLRRQVAHNHGDDDRPGDQIDDGMSGIRISIFEADQNPNGSTRFSWSFIHLVGATTTLVQLAIAAVPIILDRDWAVMLDTVAGTLLVQVAGILPQWTAEKLPNRQNSDNYYAITSGNGSRDVIVIIGRDKCLNLEDFAVTPSPRSSRAWQKFHPQPPARSRDDLNVGSRTAERFRVILYSFWTTQIVCSVLSILWLLLLVNVTAIKQYTWIMLAVGGLGMFQNAWLAATALPSEQRNMPLTLIDTIRTKKVMDGIMDFETSYRRGVPLVEEFFPGKLRADEFNWWTGNRGPYDERRMEEKESRGEPRSTQPVVPNSSLRLERRLSYVKEEFKASGGRIDHDARSPRYSSTIKYQAR